MQSIAILTKRMEFSERESCVEKRTSIWDEGRRLSIGCRQYSHVIRHESRRFESIFENMQFPKRLCPGLRSRGKQQGGRGRFVGCCLDGLLDLFVKDLQDGEC